MDLSPEPSDPAWQRQEAWLRELEMLVAILVMRHGDNGRLGFSNDELWELRASIPKVLPNVIVTYGDSFTIDVF